MESKKPLDAEGPPDVEELPCEPAPMPVRPLLQMLSWIGGLAAGGFFISLLVVSSTRTSGATRAVRLNWQKQLHPAACGVTAAAEKGTAPSDDQP